MKILGIEHLGIAVKDLANDAPFWKHILNIDQKLTEVIDDQGITTDIYDTGKGKIELLESTNSDSMNFEMIESEFVDSRSSILPFPVS
jgi:methylmalonyl-CoA/ethylmalonyl-CoA epimerase